MCGLCLRREISPISFFWSFVLNAQHSCKGNQIGKAGSQIKNLKQGGSHSTVSSNQNQGRLSFFVMNTF